MASGRLNLEERYCIHAHFQAGLSMRTIALMLDRAPSTISRELRRNRKDRGYEPQQAQRMSEQRRSRASRRPRIGPDRIRQIEALLAESHARLQSLVAAFTDEELFDPERFVWTKGAELGEFCLECGGNHYAWARGAIAAGLGLDDVA